jgi:hypothetical protein
VAPELMGWASARFIELYLRRAAPAPVTDGNLFSPVPNGRTAYGGWDRLNRPLRVTALLLGGMVAAGACLRMTRAARRQI